MEKNIQDKINELVPDKKRIYSENLRSIIEWKENCIYYGAKDPVNMPPSDINIVKINLYREMFEKNNSLDNSP